jgi:NADH-quinone oxidoreductase subunit L
MFHLMSHAFFKALLFMAAGSVIAAMANNQNIDRMGGFRRVLPLTGGLMTIGALALAGFPGTSGFFSKDEILAFAAERGSFYWILAIGGYIGALMTAVYSFRIIFRVFMGDPCPEAIELERGHLAHGEPVNPATGEIEDTDVGFPGPEHHIAEQAPPMAIAMAVLAVLSIVGGFLQIPGVDDAITRFLEPTFADSPLESITVSTADAWLGLLVGGILSILGIAIAYRIWVRDRERGTARLIGRVRPLHAFLFHKWYFDELLDALVYRPAVAFGRFCNDVVERYVVDGLVLGTVDVVRGAGSVVRGAQSGFIRFYALLVIAGIAGLGLYFLLAAS